MKATSRRSSDELGGPPRAAARALPSTSGAVAMSSSPTRDATPRRGDVHRSGKAIVGSGNVGILKQCGSCTSAAPRRAAYPLAAGAPARVIDASCASAELAVVLDDLAVGAEPAAVAQVADHVPVHGATRSCRRSPDRSGRARGGRCRRSSRRTGSRRSGGRCPALVPMPISPRRRAPGSVSSVASRYSLAALGAGVDDRARAELELDPGDLDAARARRDREADAALGGVLERAGEDLARRHVAPAVGVDPGAARRRAGAGRCPRPRCAARARRAAARSGAPGARAARPRRRPGRRGRGTSRGARRRRTRPCPCAACWAPAGVGHSVPHQRRRSAASRTGARARAARAMRAGSTPASAVVFSGAWIVSDGVASARPRPARRARRRRAARRARPPTSPRPGRAASMRSSGQALALEQLALDGEQQRRGERGRAHDDLLAGPHVEAVAAQQPGEGGRVERSRRRRARGSARRGARAARRGSSGARPARRSGSGRAAPSGA